MAVTLQQFALAVHAVGQGPDLLGENHMGLDLDQFVRHILRYRPMQHSCRFTGRWSRLRLSHLLEHFLSAARQMVDIQAVQRHRLPVNVEWRLA